MFCNCFMNPLTQMNNVEYKHTVPFVPPVTSGKVIKVYDGDTIIGSR